MKKCGVGVCVFLSLAALMAMGMAWALDVKIGVMDTKRVMRESSAAEAARTLLLEELKEKRALFNAKQEEVRLLEEDLKIKGRDMNPEILNQKQDALTREVKNLKRLKTDLEEELNKRNVELTQKITGEIGSIVREFNKSKRYTVILEKDTVIISDDAVDITGEIIRLYDAKKKKR